MATIVNQKIVSQKQCPTIRTIKNVEAIYKKYAELPTITSGTIGIESETQNVKIKIYQAQKDLINDKVEKYSTEYLLQRNNIMDHNNNNNNNKNNNNNNFKKNNIKYNTKSIKLYVRDYIPRWRIRHQINMHAKQRWKEKIFF